MDTLGWLTEGLQPIAMRLARADELAYRLAEVSLAWSRGPNDDGPFTVRQVERAKGFYDVEVTSVRPVPPVAATLFSEVIHHLRSAVDNVVFGMVTEEHGKPLTTAQQRTVSMLIYEEQPAFDRKVDRLTRDGLAVFGVSERLGQRIASLQPFNDDATVPSLPRVLAVAMGVTSSSVHPLLLLRDYSNEDKHRTIRVAGARLLVQREGDWKRSVGQGMRPVEVGTVLETVPIGELTSLDLSASLHVQRPGGTWVPFGPELDALARHVADIVIPILVTGMALPRALPPGIDLSDNGQTITERVDGAGHTRAHERAAAVSAQAYLDAIARDARWAPMAEGKSDQ